MLKPSLLSISTLLALGAAVVSAQTYGVGRPASAEEVAAWDVTIGPEGHELPEGSGTAKDGAQVYEVRCKECHGEEGVGGDQAALIGKPEQLKETPPIKTVGSYWPWDVDRGPSLRRDCIRSVLERASRRGRCVGSREPARSRHAESGRFRSRPALSRAAGSRVNRAGTPVRPRLGRCSPCPQGVTRRFPWPWYSHRATPECPTGSFPPV